MADETSRRAFLRQCLAAGAAGAALSLGCKPAKVARPGEVELNFYTYVTGDFLRLYKENLLPAFEAAHPGIKVRLTTSLGDAGYDAKLLTLIAGGIPPDVFHVTQQNFTSYAAKQLLLPLDGFSAAENDFSLADIHPNVLKGMQVNSQTLGLPSDFSTIVMLYNRDLFDRFDVSYPEPGWTREDYLAKCRALTHDTDGDGYLDTYGTINPCVYNRWPAWIWMTGGEILSEDQTHCLLDQPRAIAGMQFYADLSMKEHVAPLPSASPEMDGDRLQQLFSTGIIGMMPDSRYLYKQLLAGRGTRFKWDVAPMPRGEKQATTFIWGGNCILKSTPHAEAAWKLVKFISGAAGAEVNRLAGNALPAYQKAAEQEILHPRWVNTPEHDRYFLEAVEYARVAPSPKQYAEYSQALNGLFDAFLPSQGKSVEQTCRKFAKEVNEALSGDFS